MSNIHQCRSCNTVFTSKYALNKHSREIHQETCTVGGRVIQRTDSMFKCPLCEKTFSNSEYFRKHYRTHPTEVNVEPAAINEELEDTTNGTAELFCSLLLMEMGLKYNLKYSLLICSVCNIGLQKCEKYLANHFNNKSHAKQKVFRKIRKIWLQADF